jgi:DNA-directed RNA polymerase subunit H (RpoH/RPB5)
MDVRCARTLRAMLAARGRPHELLTDDAWTAAGVAGGIQDVPVSAEPAGSASRTRLLVSMHTRYAIADWRKVAVPAPPAERAALLLIVVREKPKTMNLVNLLRWATGAAEHTQVFHEAELLFDVAAHELQPRMTPVRDREELAALRAAYGADFPGLLPKISQHDPMARYLGLQPRDIVRVERKSAAAVRAVVHRLCV